IKPVTALIFDAHQCMLPNLFYVFVRASMLAHHFYNCGWAFNFLECEAAHVLASDSAGKFFHPRTLVNHQALWHARNIVEINIPALIGDCSDKREALFIGSADDVDFVCYVVWHSVSSCRALGTQRFNVLARLQFGAYLRRLTVIEVLKIIV
ncbi:hypothetical protein AAH476_28275, partial [Enterobacter cloacae subsp. cloacae]